MAFAAAIREGEVSLNDCPPLWEEKNQEKRETLQAYLASFGWRPNEACALKWPRVDLRPEKILIRQGRVLRLTGNPRPVFPGRPAASGTWICCRRCGRPWRRKKL